MIKIMDSKLLADYSSIDFIKKLFIQNMPPFEIRRYEAKETVLYEGQEIDGLYIQVSGRTKITTSIVTGKALLLRFCTAVSFMGDVELVQNVEVQSQVSAEDPADFLFIDKHYVKSKLLHDVVFLQTLLSEMTYKLQTCTIASRVNLLASVETRFAGYLCTIHNSSHLFGEQVQTTNHQEMASLIGTSLRHLNRVIEKLSVANIIHKEGKRLVVDDWQEIERISGGLRYE